MPHRSSSIPIRKGSDLVRKIALLKKNEADRIKDEKLTELAITLLPHQPSGDAPELDKCSIKESCLSVQEPVNIVEQIRDVREPEITIKVKKYRKPPPEVYFQPKPYTFRVPPSTNKLNIGTAKLPPFYLHLDHTLAVIWSIFSNDEPSVPLGIAQLQWALIFLQVIYNKNGDYSKDIEVCIEAIEENVISKYAELITELPKFDKTPKEDLKTSETIIPITTSSIYESGILKAVEREDTRPKRLTITKRLPFSVNYVDMIQRSPRVEELYKKRSNQSLMETVHQNISTIKTDIMKPSISLMDTCSKDEVLDFLRNCRNEHLKKIKSELKNLNSLDNFIENVDNNAEHQMHEKERSLLSVTLEIAGGDNKIQTSKSNMNSTEYSLPTKLEKIEEQTSLTSV